MNSDLLNSPDGILGQEFLTWLWYRSDTTPGAFTTRDGEAFAATLEQRITVEGGIGEEKETAAVSGAMSPLREARFGLGTGKKVTRALLRLEKDEVVFEMTLKADSLSPCSLKTPKIDKADGDDDPDALILEKISLIETALSLFDGLFSTFITLRMDPARWAQEIASMHVWMTTAD